MFFSSKSSLFMTKDVSTKPGNVFLVDFDILDGRYWWNLSFDLGSCDCCLNASELRPNVFVWTTAVYSSIVWSLDNFLTLNREGEYCTLQWEIFPQMKVAIVLMSDNSEVQSTTFFQENYKVKFRSPWRRFILEHFTSMSKGNDWSKDKIVDWTLPQMSRTSSKIAMYSVRIY